MSKNETKTTQPNWLEPNFQNIPDELKVEPWAIWKAEPRLKDGVHTGKWNKAPRNPLTGIKIGANQPEAFGTYEEAKATYEKGGYTGVGVLLTGNGKIGIDIDDAPNTLKEKPEVQEWLEDTINAGVYCELSPSRKGLRLFTLGYLPPDSPKRKGTLEIYDQGRFLTVTGQEVGGNTND